MFVKIDDTQLVDITELCEFSWVNAPGTITAGKFPDSIISWDFNDYLEGQTVLASAGSLATLQILLPETKLCFPVCVLGRGNLIDIDSDIYFYLQRFVTSTDIGGDSTKATIGTISATKYNCYDAISGYGGFYMTYAEKFLISPFVSVAGTFNFRIHNIKIIEVII